MKAKGQKRAASLPRALKRRSPSAQSQSAEQCCPVQKTCCVCSSVPSQQAELTCRCQSHVPESRSASAKPQQPSSCPCGSVRGHTVSNPPNTAHRGPHQPANDGGAYPQAPQLSTQACCWQRCLRRRSTGPPQRPIPPHCHPRHSRTERSGTRVAPGRGCQC